MKPETLNASHATTHFWREMQMTTRQARHIRVPLFKGRSMMFKNGIASAIVNS